MAQLSKYARLRVPRPKTFLGLMSLQTGTELVSLALLFNKATGVHGLLAILTGYALSVLQLSMYLYSVVVLILLALLLPHVRRQTALPNLALAWLYLLDSAVNVAYTVAFAVSWYLSSSTATGTGDAADAEGRIAAFSKRIPEEDMAPAVNSAVADGANPATVQTFGAQETAVSMALIVGSMLVRIYFSLVIMAYARQVLRRFVENQSGLAGDGAGQDEDSAKAGLTASPSAVGSAMGDGWRRRIGTLMLSVGTEYWLAEKGDEEWTKHATARLGRGQRARNPAARSS